MLHLVLNTCSVQVNAEHVVFPRGVHMSSNNRQQSLLLVSLMILASWAPLAAASDDDVQHVEEDVVGLAYSLEGLDLETNAKPYLFAGEEGEFIYSATRHLKQQWVEDGYPDLFLPFEQPANSGKSTARACENAWTTGQTGTVQTTGGQIQVSAMHVTANSCLLYTSPSPRD